MRYRILAILLIIPFVLFLASGDSLAQSKHGKATVYAFNACPDTNPVYYNVSFLNTNSSVTGTRTITMQLYQCELLCDNSYSCSLSSSANVNASITNPLGQTTRFNLTEIGSTSVFTNDYDVTVEGLYNISASAYNLSNGIVTASHYFPWYVGCAITTYLNSSPTSITKSIFPGITAYQNITLSMDACNGTRTVTMSKPGTLPDTWIS
ncbi:MAG: hypothetical protein HYS53_02905, partial [Candidatus Aenigmarchaeota archaeon]|nr:hypothetical protein [Candidatus Aenigmarchaeota archaeon]